MLISIYMLICPPLIDSLSSLQRQQFEEERHAKAAEISQLHGRLAELRHQLETSRMKADQEARKHDEELAATNATLNELKLENADLEVCLLCAVPCA
jgi:septal ring factor EnvC (AmiA/AmiB activator)